jgi:hypothetical protein
LGTSLATPSAPSALDQIVQVIDVNAPVLSDLRDGQTAVGGHADDLSFCDSEVIGCFGERQ